MCVYEQARLSGTVQSKRHLPSCVDDVCVKDGMKDTHTKKKANKSLAEVILALNSR